MNKKMIIGAILLLGAIVLFIGISEYDKKKQEEKIELESIEADAEANNQVVEMLNDKTEARNSINDLIAYNSDYTYHIVTPNEMYSGIAHSQNGYNECTITVLQGEIKLSNYYNYDYTNSEEYAAIQITDQETFQTFYGYAQRETFKELLSILGSSPSNYGTVTLSQCGESMDNGEEAMGTIKYMKIN